MQDRKFLHASSEYNDLLLSNNDHSSYQKGQATNGNKFNNVIKLQKECSQLGPGKGWS